MLTVENAEILTPQEGAILSNAMNIAADEWDRLADEVVTDSPRMKEAFKGYAKTARELAEKSMGAEFIIFDRGSEV